MIGGPLSASLAAEEQHLYRYNCVTKATCRESVQSYARLRLTEIIKGDRMELTILT